MATNTNPSIEVETEGPDIVVRISTAPVLLELSLELTASQARRLAADLIHCAEITEA